MTTITSRYNFSTLSPGLKAEDPLAEYWMRQVSIRLRREVCWLWRLRAPDSRADSTSPPPITDNVSESLSLSRYWEEKKAFLQTDQTAKYLTNQLEASPPPANTSGARGSFDWAINTLELDDTASFTLALGLVATFDSAIGSVVAACLNDPAKTNPSLALAQKLWDDPSKILGLADPEHPLFRFGLLQMKGRAQSNASGAFWDSPLITPPSVARQLLFPDSATPRACVPIAGGEDVDERLADSASVVVARLKSDMRAEALRVVPIRGPRGSAPDDVVRAITRATGRDTFEFAGAPLSADNLDCLTECVTLCWLRGNNLFLGLDAVSSLSPDRSGLGACFAPMLSIPITIFLAVTDRSQLNHIPDETVLPIIDMPAYSYADRVAHWKKSLGSKAEGLDHTVAECSRRFRYEKKVIDRIAGGLDALSGKISEDYLFRACRAEQELDLGDLAQKVKPRFSDEKLILPPKQRAQFDEVTKAMRSLTEVHYEWGMAEAWNESGISVLFAGPSGTGKTMGAEILAIELDLPMYRIDLSQVINKYIGETEKNLKLLFDAADVSDIILFFDEADSIFGRRTEVKDAHDRYANLEISYLLERMERFKGLAILATNRKKDLDEAFLRRLRYIIDFPMPGVAERKAIWDQVLPAIDTRPNIDIDFLAEQFAVAGGHIRSLVFNACLQSANGVAANGALKRQLTMEQIIVSVKREYDKLNKSVSLDQFGPYADIVRRMEQGK